MCKLKSGKCCQEVNGEETTGCWCRLKSDRAKQKEIEQENRNEISSN